MKYYELFEKLESMSGRKDKEKLIKENWSEELKQIFLRVYDYNRQSYTNKFIDLDSITEYPELNKEDLAIIENHNIVELFDFLSKRGSACNWNKYVVACYFDEIYKNSIQHKWDKRILLKDLKIGISQKTLNKLFEPFIPVFDVMLANKVENIDELEFPIIAQPKLDGIRCLKVGKSLIGRNGKFISNIKLYEFLQSIIQEENYIFDGELYSHELTFNDILSQINSDDKELHPSIRYTIYDLITKTEWENKKCTTKYYDRWQRILSFVHNKENMVWIGGKIVNSVKELNDYYEECLKDGFEGIMIKDLNGLYEWKRVKQNVMGKIKPSEDHDVIIKGFQEGEGRNEKSLGAFICDFNGVSVKVGSGFDDKQRKEYWENRNTLLDTWVTVKAQEITKDGSLRFPVFVRFRDAK